MQKSTTRSDVLEKEFESGSSWLIGAVILLIVSLVGWWLTGGLNSPGSAKSGNDLAQGSYFRELGQVVGKGKPAPETNPESPPLFLALNLLSRLGVIGALVLGAIGGLQMFRARESPKVTANCPYCGHPMEFLKEPTEDYDCEGCHRPVHFQNGVLLPIRTITCAFCKTIHRVSTKTTHYTCERCNRALRLTDPYSSKTVVEERTELFQNYDVILTDVGRPKDEAGIAMELESILICNLPEARRQMANLPLVVARSLPERKADAIRRRLRERGATAIIRPSATSEQAPPRRR